MTKGVTLVVLAAGVGSRYGGLKQLEAVGPSSESLLEYSLFDAIRVGIERTVLVVRPETQAEFERRLSTRLPMSIEFSYVHQTIADVPSETSPVKRSKPWGTAQAVLAAEKELRGPFLVINADDFYGADAFKKMVDFARGEPGDLPPTYALAGFGVGSTLSDTGPVSRGLCRVDPSGWLEKIVEVKRMYRHRDGGRYTDAAGVERIVNGDDLVSMNMWGFTPAIFPQLRQRFQRFIETTRNEIDPSPEFLIPDAVQGIVADGDARIRVLHHHGRWCGITFPEDRGRVQRFIATLVARGEYLESLWER